MKLTDEFHMFLQDEVNLNNTRIEKLKAHVRSIEKFLGDSEWKRIILRYSAQGSWAHKTIIKPQENRGFDADLLMFIKPVSGWAAKDYVFSLRGIFLNSEVYKEKTTLGNRCVTIDYAGDFNIDIVPCVVSRPGGARYFEVCNRRDNTFEETDSEAYSAWLAERNNWIGSNYVIESIRLMKYLRDTKQTFSCKSILLTTLIGNQLAFSDTLHRDLHFSDLPTTLKTLVGRLDGYLQKNPKLHEVVNPVLPDENFTRHWDDDKYQNFREVIHRYRCWIDDAFSEADETTSIEKWQEVFGDEFGRGKQVGSKEIVKLAEARLLPDNVVTPYMQDAVGAVILLGPTVLSRVRQLVPWMKPAPWRNSNQLSVPIQATVHLDRSGDNMLGNLDSGQITRKGVKLRFEAFMPNGLSYSGSNDFDVQWQVVNSDRDAWSAGSLRGGFYRSDSKGVRWETTQFRGVHWVQAFVIRRRDRSCVGRSERFFVVIE